MTSNLCARPFGLRGLRSGARDSSPRFEKVSGIVVWLRQLS